MLLFLWTLSPFRQPLLYTGFVAVAGRVIVRAALQLVGEVLLLHVMAGEVVGVLVAFAVPDPLRAPVVGVPQVDGDRAGRLVCEVLAHPRDGLHHGVTLGRGGDVEISNKESYISVGSLNFKTLI